MPCRARSPKIARARQRVRLNGRSWFVFSEPNAVDRAGAQRPAGPNRAQLARYQQGGWDIAYRPVNYPNLANVGADFPKVNYLIHEGLEVAGNPNLLSETVAASQGYLTGLIEGTDQAGMSAISSKVPLARTFSVSQEWLNTLKPQEVADKYLLAANERGARLLYLRPYTDETVGDMQSEHRSVGHGADGRDSRPKATVSARSRRWFSRVRLPCGP